jgi:transposase-like protein
MSTNGSRAAAGGGHLQCPFCEAYQVERLYLASVNLDSCHCASCGASWDEDPVTGEYRGRASHESVITPRRL